MLNGVLREELRARHKFVWLLEWGLGRVVQRGLGYMLMGIFLGVCSKRRWVKTNRDKGEIC